MGKDVGLNLKELFNFLNTQPELKGVEIGNIDINKDYTLFEVDQRFKEKVLACFANSDINGAPVKISCEETGIQSSRDPNRQSKGRGRPHGRRRSPKGRSSHRKKF